MNGFVLTSFKRRDAYIMMLTMVPMGILITLLVFGERILDNGFILLAGLCISLIACFAEFLICYAIAVFLRLRFPQEHQNRRRIFISIGTFILTTCIMMALLLRAFSVAGVGGYVYQETDYLPCVASMAAMNIFFTLLYETINRFQHYQNTVRETAQLRKEYLQSQLLGLKSQVNPHFLFNSLNTLSSLIHDNPERAEEFLNHLSKVYRYMLRDNEEQLVTLGTELGFVHSFFFLLKARHNEGLSLHLRIPETSMDLMIPPLTLQMLIENACAENMISRSQPLQLKIAVSGNSIIFSHNIMPRVNAAGDTEALDNIANKIRLLSGEEIMLSQRDQERVIEIPLIPSTQRVAV